MASTSGAIRAGRAFVEIFADDSKLQRGLKRASQTLKSWGASVAKIGAVVSAASAVVAGPMLLAVRGFAQFGDELDKMAARTGMVVENLSLLRFAAEQSGTSLGAVERAALRMARTITDAGRGTKEAKDALAMLGLTAEQIGQLSPDDQFMLIAQRLSEIENPTTRAAAAMMIFGRGAGELLPLLNQGANGMQALMDKGRELGLQLSGEDAAAARDLKDAWHAVTSAFTAAKNMIGAALAPALTDLANRIGPYIKLVRDWIDGNRNLVTLLFQVAVGVGVVGAGITALGGALAGAGFALAGLSAGLGLVGALLAKMAAAFAFLASPIGVVTAAVMGLAGFLIYASGVGGKAVEWLSEQFAWLQGVVGTTMQGIMDAIAAGDLGLAFEAAWSGALVVFHTYTQRIKEAWSDAKWWLLSVWDEATFGIASAWIKMTGILESVWLNAMNRIDSVWTGTQASLAEGFAWVIAKVQGLDPEQVMALAREDIEGQGARRQAGRTDLAELIEREQTDALAANEAARQEAQRRRQQEYAAQIQGAQQDLDDATRRWEEATGRAAEAREQIEQAAAPTLEERLSELGGAMAGARSGGSAAGTFSAAAAMVMGRGVGADPMLQKADRQIDLLAQIERAVAGGVMVLD